MGQLSSNLKLTEPIKYKKKVEFKIYSAISIFQQLSLVPIQENGSPPKLG